MMLVPGVLTGSQIGEYRAFSGSNTKLRQDFRIWWAYEYRGKSAQDYALINPYHIGRDGPGLLPEIHITRDAFRLIRDANREAPVDSAMMFYSRDSSVKPTNLCLNFIAQRAGPYERLLLGTKGDIPIQAIHPCGEGAR